MVSGRQLARNGFGMVHSATTPVIRHIPGGVERMAGRNAVQMAFSRGMRCIRSATTPIFPRIPGVVDEKSLIGVLCGVERESGMASRGGCSEY